MLCLAQAKKVEQDLDAEKVGQRRILTREQKWNEISVYLNGKGYTDRAGSTCNTKWNNMFGDWKAVVDFSLPSGGLSYMSKNERLQAKLVPKFNKELYDLMDLFCLQRPCMVPPSVNDSGLASSSRNPRVPEAPPQSPSAQTVVDDNGPQNLSTKQLLQLLEIT